MEDYAKKIWMLERQVFQLQTLFEIAQSLNVCRDQSSVYERILATMAGTFGAREAIAFTYENGIWRCIATRGSLAGSKEQLEQVANENFNQATVRRQQQLLVEFTNGTADFDLSYTLWTYVLIRARIAGGCFFGRKIIGEPYSREDEELLAAVCSYAAHVVDNLALYQALAEVQQRLAEENRTLRQRVRHEIESKNLIGTSRSIRRVLETIQSYARSEAAVLIAGETGTGKELVAHAIHYASPRADGPFVAINCTAIPETLVESEFFGIEAGAATGVRQRIGYFEQADGGTIFIDEVGDMPLSSQAKLLRTLQEHTLRRVGGTREIKIDVRVLVATNKDLKQEIRAGRFREDLYYRLGVLELAIPPLRQRREDIALLANHFLEKLQNQLGRRLNGFSPEAVRLLEQYEWPGNVRELENEIERVVTLANDGDVIRPEHLSLYFLDERAADFLRMDRLPQSLRAAIARLESVMIENALATNGGNKSAVARQLGLSRLGLQRKMARLKINYGEENHDDAAHKG